MKIKCIKAECPVCKTVGSDQLFFNKDGNLAMLELDISATQTKIPRSNSSLTVSYKI